MATVHELAGGGQLCDSPSSLMPDRGHDGPSPHEATINYTLSDCGDHYTITPRCYFETKGSRAKVKVDKDTGRL